MATVTPNLGLTLPIGSEKVSRSIINGNMTIIDTGFGNISNQITAISEQMSAYVSISNSSYANDKFTSAFTTISNNSAFVEGKTYPVMLYFAGGGLTGTFTGTFNVTAGGIRFVVSDETHLYQGLFLRSNNTLSSLNDLNAQMSTIRFGLAKTIHNANTDKNVESNRTTEMEYLKTNNFDHGQTVAIVRYQSGYYFAYLYFGDYTNGDGIFLELCHNLTSGEKLICWHRNNATGVYTKGFSLS